MIGEILTLAGAFTVGFAAASLGWAALLRGSRRRWRMLARRHSAMSGQVETLLRRSDGLLNELLELRAHLRRWPGPVG